VDAPPKILGDDMCVNPVSMVFASFQDYCNTFFPLILHEIWASSLKYYEENKDLPQQVLSLP